MSESLDQVRAFLAMGGFVMAPLLLVGVFLWYFLLLRWWVLRRGVRGDLEVLVANLEGAPGAVKDRGIVGGVLFRIARRLREAKHLSATEIDVFIARARLETKQHAKLITSLVASAPLLGLLGTVSDSKVSIIPLTDMSMFSRTGGGISGGISEALTTTQMGLGIAIPGLLVSRILEARARRLRSELGRVGPILATVRGETSQAARGER